VERQTLLWTLVVFFGASTAFQLVQNATADDSLLVTIAAEVVVLGAIVGLIVVLVRRRSR
jgi:membrane protein DedA with SNARE-associated domain